MLKLPEGWENMYDQILIFESDWLRKCYKFSDLSRGKAHVKQNKINP